MRIRIKMTQWMYQKVLSLWGVIVFFSEQLIMYLLNNIIKYVFFAIIRDNLILVNTFFRLSKTSIYLLLCKECVELCKLWASRFLFYRPLNTIGLIAGSNNLYNILRAVVGGFFTEFALSLEFKLQFFRKVIFDFPAIE